MHSVYKTLLPALKAELDTIAEPLIINHLVMFQKKNTPKEMLAYCLCIMDANLSDDKQINICMRTWYTRTPIYRKRWWHIVTILKNALMEGHVTCDIRYFFASHDISSILTKTCVSALWTTIIFPGNVISDIYIYIYMDIIFSEASDAFLQISS